MGIKITGGVKVPQGKFTVYVAPPPPPAGPQLWTWGKSQFGQLGNGQANSYPSGYSSPIQISALTTWAQVEASDDHSSAIKTDGTLWAWGEGSNGRLGHGNTTDYSSPVQVGRLTDWGSAVLNSGTNSTLAVKSNGTLWGWGANANGTLGTGGQKSSPTQIGSLTTWATVSCGQTHSLAVKTDGTLWSWGYGGNGQLGNGATSPGTISSPVQIGSLTTWASVNSGSGGSRQHSTAVKTDGTLWTWGRNNRGQLGLGDINDRSSPVQVPGSDWASVLAASEFTLARKTDGTIWAWGRNFSGDLGLGDLVLRSSPVQIGSLTTWASIDAKESHSFAIKNDGTLWAWGQQSGGRTGTGAISPGLSSPVQVGSLTDWADVSAGDEHSLAIKSDGTLEAWGRASFGELGNNQANVYSINYSSPIQIGSLVDWASVDVALEHSLAVKTDGTLWAWGRNKYGELADGTVNNASSPVQIGNLTDWASISAGERFSTSVKTDGTLWSWGIGNNGRLGLGDSIKRSSPVQIGNLTTWSSVSSGFGFTLAVKTDGRLWAWGFGSYGRLGLGNTTSYSSPVQVGSLNNWASVSAEVNPSRPHSLAVKTDGTMWSWGRNNRGQLGLNNVSDRSSPVQIGSLTTWANVSSGLEFSLATKTDGTLWSWGVGNQGRLGLGDSYINRSSPVQVGNLTTWSKGIADGAHAFGIKTDGTIWGWGSNVSGSRGHSFGGNYSSPVQIGSETNWTSISGADAHTIAIKTTT